MPDATRGETRQRRPRLPADPYYGRHCAFLPRTSQKAEGSCSRIVISGPRTALSPWLWARIDFVDGASFQLSSSPPHNGGMMHSLLRRRGNDPLSKPCSVSWRERKSICREGGEGRNFRPGIILQASSLTNLVGLSRDSRCVVWVLFFFFFPLLRSSGARGNARRVAFYPVAKRLRCSL